MENTKERDGPSLMEKAHAHVAAGEDYEVQGLLVCAFPEFYKAAELFLACMDQVENPHTKQTLKLLYNENNRRGKELQRRVALNREEAHSVTNPRTQSPNRAGTLAPSSRYESPSRTNTRENNLTMSQRTIDDSYMVLGGRTDPQDPFNQFWSKLEQVLDNLSQPVAFATIPLTSSYEPTGDISTKDQEEEGYSDDSEVDPSRSRPKLLDHMGVNSQEEQENLADKLAQALEDDADLIDEFGMDESFYVVPSVASPSMKKLQAENIALKQELQVLKTRLGNAEKTIKGKIEQERAIRDSIISVRREAQRAISSSALIGGRPGSLANLEATLPSIMPPLTNIQTQQTSGALGPEREGQYVRRIRELEEELRQSRVENEKNRATIQRFRERWEKLKESAKRKRSAKAAENARGDSVKETIQEEPELEVEGAA
ncbi:hypothetical protein FRC14_001010 [Serendipita sp. 396]|nr:hypothetical protein FRC14_001010 [Serendipita sp. 396]KAG8785744.1 hypothetical protein FRC15_000763 [Serendipita sp. 397]KAG8870307.1 hypothetical protein FRC20_012035 [Serendipita sp. 405]